MSMNFKRGCIHGLFELSWAMNRISNNFIRFRNHFIPPNTRDSRLLT